MFANHLALLWLGSGLGLCVPTLAAGADAPAPPAVITAVRAVVRQGCTQVDLRYRGGETDRRVTTQGRQIEVVLPNASLGADLPQNTATGGLVSGIAITKDPQPGAGVHLRLALKEPGSAAFVPAEEADTLRLDIAPFRKEAANPPVAAASTAGRYEIHAYQQDVAALLLSLAHDAHINIMLAGTVNSKVTVDIREEEPERAIELLTRAAGLAYRRDGATYVIGAPKDIEAAYPPALTPHPKESAQVLRPLGPERADSRPRKGEGETRHAVYHCVNISASDLASTLEKMYDKDRLRVAAGAGAISPRLLDPVTTGSTTGTAISGNPAGGTRNGGSFTGADSQGNTQRLMTREVILSGDPATVEDALTLARQLDARRAQVKVRVTITDIDTDALKQLGIQWDWSNYTVQETKPNGIAFGTFTHNPVSINATISALQTADKAKLLAAPTLTLLDGEQSYILIGDRLRFPKLVGYTQASTPIYDTDEERVGIYLQVSAQIGENGEMTLTLYPQVSTVTSFLNVGGASYPQISTREQQTTIRVRSGEQIVVGGLIRNEELENMQRVPILSRIPLLGELFTWRKTTRTHSELIVTITPELLKD